MKTRLAIVLFALTALGAAQVEVVHVFPGRDGPHPAGAPAPSVDTMGGVGPKHLVDFFNGGVVMRSKSDGKEVQPYQTMEEFWRAALKNAGKELPAYPYDPRIFFDPLTSRWFAIADVWLAPPPGGGRGSCCLKHILLGVSRDDDPTHPWKALDIETQVQVDNVKIGLDKNGVYLTELEAGNVDQPAGWVLVVPKADLLWKGGDAPSLAHMNRLEVKMAPRMADRRFRGEWGMIPVFDLNPKKKLSDPEIYINRYRTEVDGETMIQIRKVMWTSPTQASVSDPIEIGLGTHDAIQPTSRGVQPALPEGMYAPGLAPGEGRLVNAIVRDGSVWTIAATEVNNRTGAFWVQIDLASMKLVQRGTLADADADLLFPSLNVDGDGNLGIAVMRTSANEAASTYVTGRLRSDPPNQLRPLVRAVEGRFPYFLKNTDLTKPNQGVPTSDFATAVLDPSDPTLIWSYQFAAINNCLPQQENGGRYATRWVAFRVGAANKPGKSDKPVSKK